jgi:serine/threonine-protein kinase
MNLRNLSGQVLGQYELRELLGTGAMGVVYRGYQRNLARAVAIKVLMPSIVDDPSTLERFYREARIAASLEHAHIVPIYDYGVTDDITYVSMRLLTGGSLADRISYHAEQNQVLPSLGEILEMLKQVASALDYAHSQGVIHRDIKPSNIMFDHQGSAYLVDFGIAKLIETTHALTVSGTAMGTPVFMPPEQWLSEPLTPAADQYALGVTVYVLVTGTPPFEASNPYGLMYKHLREIAAPPHLQHPEVPEAVSLVLARALAKDPAARFPTVIAFAQAFEQAISGHSGRTSVFFTAAIPDRPVIPLPSTGEVRTPTVLDSLTRRKENLPAQAPTVKRKTQRSGIWRVVGAGVGLALAAVVIGLWLLFGQSKDQPDSRGDNTAAISTQVAQTLAAVVPPSPTYFSSATSMPPTWTPVATATGYPSAPPSPTALGFLADVPGLTVVAPVPDTATLLFSVRSSANSGALYALDGGIAVLVLNYTNGSLADVTWMSGGAGIMVSLRPANGTSDIYMLPVGETHLYAVVYDSADDFSPAWSPDGRYLVFASNRGSEHSNVFVQDMLTGTTSQLTTFTDRNAWAAVWSPDGQQIAFHTFDAQNWYTLYLMNADGSHQRSISGADLKCSYPSWAPNGHELVFSGVAATGMPQIYAMNLDGSNRHQLTTMGINQRPVWSPDGSQIAYIVSQNQSGQLYLMGADGRSPSLAAAVSDVSTAAWRP